MMQILILVLRYPLIVCTGCPKKYSSLTKNQTIAFLFYCLIFLDSKYSFIDFNFDTSTTNIR